jgi:hypothetical protein
MRIDDQVEIAATGRASDVNQTVGINHLDWIMAVRETDVHGHSLNSLESESEEHSKHPSTSRFITGCQ